MKEMDVDNSQELKKIMTTLLCGRQEVKALNDQAFKNLMTALRLKMKDFKLRCINTRRYGSEVYSWYSVDHKGAVISCGDPNIGRLNLSTKQSFILEYIFEACPALSHYQSETSVRLNKWGWLSGIVEKDKHEMFLIWLRRNKG